MTKKEMAPTDEPEQECPSCRLYAIKFETQKPTAGRTSCDYDTSDRDDVFDLETRGIRHTGSKRPVPLPQPGVRGLKPFRPGL